MFGLILDLKCNEISCGEIIIMLSPVLGTVQEFVDYAIWIVGFLIVYYCIKFIFVAGPPGKNKKERKAEEEELKAGVTGFLDKRKASKEKKEKAKKDAETAEEEARKKKKGKQERKEKLNPIRGMITKCIRQAEDAGLYLDQSKIKKAMPLIKKLKKNLFHARRTLQDRRDEMGEQRDALNKLAANVQQMLGSIKEKVIDPLKKTTPDPQDIRNASTKLGEYRKTSATVFNELTELIKG